MNDESDEEERDEEIVAGGGASSRLGRLLRALTLRTGLLPPLEMPPRSVLIRLALALVLAVVLWVSVSAAEDPVRRITYQNLHIIVSYPAGYYAVKGPPLATVVVEGLSSDFKDSSLPAVSADVAHVSLASSGPVTVTVPVRVSNLPDGVHVVSVNPRTVRLSLETALSRTIPVYVFPQGQPPPGYLHPVFSSSPSTVRITGPSDVVSRVVAARVLIDQSTLTHNESLRVEPQLFDRKGRGVSRRIVRIQPAAVTVMVHVTLPPVPQTLTIVPDITGTVAAGYRISNVAVIPSVVQVLSSAPVPATTTLTTAPITLTGVTTTQIRQAQLIVPTGLSLPRSQQATVTVEVDVVPIRGSVVTTAQVLVVGAHPGTTVTLTPTTVTVTYEGPLSTLNRAAAPQAVLDVRHLRPGTYRRRPTIVLAPGLSLLRLTPPYLRVTVAAPTPTPDPTARPTATRRPRPTATSRPRPTATPRPRPTATPRPARPRTRRD